MLGLSEFKKVGSVLDRPSEDERAVAIFKTKDYNKFKFIDYNRGLKQSHVDILKASIMQENRLSLHPIIVTESFDVIDGQHRLHAAKQLNLAIYYIIDRHVTRSSLMFDQVNKGWSAEDYMRYYAKQGCSEYIKFFEYIDRYSLTFAQLYSICVRRGAETTLNARKGLFKVKGNILEFLEDCKTILFFLKHDVPHNLRRTVISSDFMAALYAFWAKFPAKIPKLTENMPSHFPKLVVKGSKIMFLKCLVDIYNHSKKLRIRYRSMEELHAIFED